MILRSIIIIILKVFGLYKEFVVPDNISEKFIQVNEAQLMKIQKSLKKNKPHAADFSGHLIERLERFRRTHIPLLIETIGLEGKKILEIGCGTGSSAVALAEQGAILTAIDIDEDSIIVAKEKMKIYGLEAEFIKANAIDIKDSFGGRKWDMIIFYASLEHMTHRERNISIGSAYDVLKNGKHLCVFGSPNRLYHSDKHTSWLPFYMWLQDEIALDYAKFSERKNFTEAFGEIHKNNYTNYEIDLYRWGRGISFHEFELAIKRADRLKVVGCLNDFLIGKRSWLQQMKYKTTDEYKYSSFLSKFGPNNVHPGFYHSYIDLIIEKDEEV